MNTKLNDKIKEILSDLSTSSGEGGFTDEHAEWVWSQILAAAPVQPQAAPDGWIVTMANAPGKSVFTRSRFMPVKRNAEVCAEQWRKETPLYHVEVVGVFFATITSKEIPCTP